MPDRFFVFGLGYSALAFARLIKPRAEWIGGTVRTADKAAKLRAEAIDTFVFDGTAPGEGIAAALDNSTHCVIAIPPGENGDPVLAHHAEDLVAAKNLSWISYLSTVGVYGNSGGAWIDECTTPRPQPGRSTRRLEAEEAWRNLAERRDIALAISRIAGIYGPGRNALQALADGKARRVIKQGQVFNRIHVDDIAQTLEAELARRADGVFNLADDEPSPPQDVVAFAANLMGVEPPPEVPFEEADLSPMAKSFYGENKRVSNRRLREELGVALCYPTYRDGLTALWRDRTWRGELDR